MGTTDDVRCFSWAVAVLVGVAVTLTPNVAVAFSDTDHPVAPVLAIALSPGARCSLPQAPGTWAWLFDQDPGAGSLDQANPDVPMVNAGTFDSRRVTLLRFDTHTQQWSRVTYLVAIRAGATGNLGLQPCTLRPAPSPPLTDAGPVLDRVREYGSGPLVPHFQHEPCIVSTPGLQSIAVSVGQADVRVHGVDAIEVAEDRLGLAGVTGFRRTKHGGTERVSLVVATVPRPAGRPDMSPACPLLPDPERGAP